MTPYLGTGRAGLWVRPANLHYRSVAYTRVGDLLLGLTALALLRGRVQELGGKRYSDARVNDLRRILDHWGEPALQRDANWQPAAAADGYAVWAQSYDDEANPLIELDQATLAPLIARHASGAALDAACGTGRWSKFLAERGFAVIGVDESPEMLERATSKLPSVDFRRADVRSLPVGSESLDLVVCSLALTHLPELDNVMAEFARVLRPGGAAIVSNIHHLSQPLGGSAEVVLPDGRLVRLPLSLFLPSDYVNAAVNAGFTIRVCIEACWPDAGQQYGGPTAQEWCAEAAHVAYTSTPGLIALELVKPVGHTAHGAGV